MAATADGFKMKIMMRMIGMSATAADSDNRYRTRKPKPKRKTDPTDPRVGLAHRAGRKWLQAHA
jgi:hypothetical protein